MTAPGLLHPIHHKKCWGLRWCSDSCRVFRGCWESRTVFSSVLLLSHNLEQQDLDCSRNDHHSFLCEFPRQIIWNQFGSELGQWTGLSFFYCTDFFSYYVLYCRTSPFHPGEHPFNEKYGCCSFSAYSHPLWLTARKDAAAFINDKLIYPQRISPARGLDTAAFFAWTVSSNTTACKCIYFPSKVSGVTT